MINLITGDLAWPGATLLSVACVCITGLIVHFFPQRRGNNR